MKKDNIFMYMPELLEDLWSLGASLDSIVEILKPLYMPTGNTNVLDLGCGKGAVSVTLAQKYNCIVLGVDNSKNFLRVAKKKARQHDVEDLCRFELIDIFDFLKKESKFDIVIFASLGGLLGNFRECIGRLRQMVYPNGYIVIDDGFSTGGSKIEEAGFEHFISHDDTIEQLTSYGDVLLEEINTEREKSKINLQYLETIKRRAKQIIQRKPDLSETITRHIISQEKACEVLDKHVTGAIWLLQCNCDYSCKKF